MTEEETKAAERQLIREADYFYYVDDWEFTAHDPSEISEYCELYANYGGDVIEIGRFKSLENIYAVNVPITWDENGDAEEWEVKVFATREGAAQAYAAARAKGEAMAPASKEAAQ